MFYLSKKTQIYFGVIPFTKDYEIAGELKYREENGITILDIGNTIQGDKESVNIIESKYSFHTHPLNIYKKYGVNTGFPSVDDILSVIWCSISFKSKFHIVVAVEGLYVLWCTNNIDTYDDNLHQYIMNNYNLCRYIDKTPYWFVDKINNMKNPIVKAKYIPKTEYQYRFLL